LEKVSIGQGVVAVNVTAGDFVDMFSDIEIMANLTLLTLLYLFSLFSAKQK